MTSVTTSHRRLVATVLLLLMALGARAATQHLRFNTSASLPFGLYYLERPARPSSSPGQRGIFAPGDVVLACPPPEFARLALARHYLPAGACPGGSQPLGKLVLAVAGDRLQLQPSGIVLNGQPLACTAPAAADAAGRPLPQPPADSARYVRAGALWLVSPHARSLDSRYFGAVSAADVLGRLHPLVSWGGSAPDALAAAIRRAHVIPPIQRAHVIPPIQRAQVIPPIQ